MEFADTFVPEAGINESRPVSGAGGGMRIACSGEVEGCSAVVVVREVGLRSGGGKSRL